MVAVGGRSIKGKRCAVSARDGMRRSFCKGARRAGGPEGLKPPDRPGMPSPWAITEEGRVVLFAHAPASCTAAS